jgi:hypothetical protein
MKTIRGASTIKDGVKKLRFPEKWSFRLPSGASSLLSFQLCVLYSMGQRSRLCFDWCSVSFSASVQCWVSAQCLVLHPMASNDSVWLCVFVAIAAWRRWCLVSVG